jgi:energy-coupling factor transporter ATP-binding protein EcfA2
MFIKDVAIKGYKPFSTEGCVVPLNAPDGTPGSGLTILVGANGVGKTSVLEALNLATNSAYTVQNRLTAHDFYQESRAIEVRLAFTEPCKYKMPEIYRDAYFNCNGVVLEASFRAKKSPGRLLSPALQVSCNVTTSDDTYTTGTGKEGQAINDFHRMFDDSKLNDPLNIFYFDKNRTRHLTSGTYRTTFDRIIEDLNWKFLNGVFKDEAVHDAILDSSGAFEQGVFAATKSPAGRKPIEETREFFGLDDLKHLSLNLFSLQWPFANAFFASREPRSLAQIPVSKLGSGIEMVFALHLLRAISEQSKGSIIYLIDEPELSLHPQAQRRLLELLVEESGSKQIVIATHSAEFVDPSLITRIVRLRKEAGVIHPSRITDVGEIGDIQEERRVFFRRHRNLFFMDEALFVEGIDDYERYGIFCEQNGYGDLADKMVMMNGADPTFAFEALCRQLRISFAAIVDKDFSVKRSPWARARNRRQMQRVVDFLKSKGVPIDEVRLAEAIQAESQETARKDDHEAVPFDSAGTEILKVKDRNVLVLKDGELFDYLDENGAVSDGDPAKAAELIAILRAAREMLAAR